ncbi:Acetoin utilization deacetylase AcuC [Roseivivax halotolerans]|uniref:Acetoin utilization deacetylase AcuC n=1 Tax=Roseivivax halotolerans TaxID=93684 RepID=A0A1I5ZV33_9RHOB|nr:histone deacetylase family protein [Roseivivax halotolerans]SFQ60260.1 Acetoin utilization deacetylase AcuC [Roseivivax halotolerans]
MRAFFDDRQMKHEPKGRLVAGVMKPSPEEPERAVRLKRGAEAAGYIVEAPGDYGLGPIARVHDPAYIRFLETIHERWARLDGASEEVMPNVHPANRTDSYPASPVGLAGFHMADTACPIGPDTWFSAYWSAQAALSAADALMTGERGAYALCRPPGHHAFADLAGGFCYLNNSAIAAEHLTRAGRRVAILDVDVHHGNGTQGIFYSRGDVLTVSIHADPMGFYPFYWGHAHERGEGAGRGANLNLPLARGQGDAEFLDALSPALAQIRAFGTDALVIALGLDAYEGDPLKGLAVTTEGFTRIGAAIAEAGMPTLFVQEGGYLSEALEHNLTSVLGGFHGA